MSKISALYGLEVPLVTRDSTHQATGVYFGVPKKVIGKPVPAFVQSTEAIVPPQTSRFDRVSQYETPQLKFGRQYTLHQQLPTDGSDGRDSDGGLLDFNGPPDGKGQWAEPASGKKQVSEWIYENKHVKREDGFDSENREFFSAATIETIYRGVRSALSDLRMDGKPVDLDRERIKELMGMVFEQRFDRAQVMIDYCINTAAEQIRNELEMIQQNEALDIWVTQYTGDPAYFNMVSHSKIKLNHKRAQGIDFNMVF